MQFDVESAHKLHIISVCGHTHTHAHLHIKGEQPNKKIVRFRVCVCICLSLLIQRVIELLLKGRFSLSLFAICCFFLNTELMMYAFSRSIELN